MKILGAKRIRFNSIGQNCKSRPSLILANLAGIACAPFSFNCSLSWMRRSVSDRKYDGTSFCLAKLGLKYFHIVKSWMLSLLDRNNTTSFFQQLKLRDCAVNVTVRLFLIWL